MCRAGTHWRRPRLNSVDSRRGQRVRPDYEAGLSDKYFVVACRQALRPRGESNPGPEEKPRID